ncbi:SIS domain-containing protein [Erwinia sp. CPCC 100877]|nr:SIS domain-containing protein [Erwinia sp. CPCC 100877]
MNEIYKKIRYNYANLSEAEQEVVDFILTFEDIGKLKLKDIKEQLFVSNATIIRACKKLNYATFNELKYAFMRSQKRRVRTFHAKSASSKIIEEIKREIVTALEFIDEKSLTQICIRVLDARRIFCVGTGASKTVASEFHQKLKLINLWSNDYLDELSIECISRMCEAEDVVLIFSSADETAPMNKSIVKAKNNGAVIITVTNMPHNQLEQISHYSLQAYSIGSHKKSHSALLLHLMSSLIYEKLLMKKSDFE